MERVGSAVRNREQEGAEVWWELLMWDGNMQWKLSYHPHRSSHCMLSDLRPHCQKFTAQHWAGLAPHRYSKALTHCQVLSSCDKGRFVSQPLYLPAHGKLQKFPYQGEQLSWVTLELQALKVSLLLEPRHISRTSQDWKQPSTFNGLPFIFNKGLGVIFPANTLKSR